MKHNTSLSKGLLQLSQPKLDCSLLNIQGIKFETKQQTKGVGGQMSIQGSRLQLDEPDQRQSPEEPEEPKTAIRFELESQGTVHHNVGEVSKGNTRKHLQIKSLSGVNHFINEQTLLQEFAVKQQKQFQPSILTSFNSKSPLKYHPPSKIRQGFGMNNTQNLEGLNNQLNIADTSESPMIIKNDVIEIVTKGNFGQFAQYELIKQQKYPDSLKYKYKLDDDDGQESIQPIINSAIINRKKFLSMTNRQHFNRGNSKSHLFQNTTQSKFQVSQTKNLSQDPEQDNYIVIKTSPNFKNVLPMQTYMTLEQANGEKIDIERIQANPLVVQKLQPNPIKKRTNPIMKLGNSNSSQHSPISTKYGSFPKGSKFVVKQKIKPIQKASLQNSFYSSKTQKRLSHKDVMSSPGRKMNKDLEKVDNEFSESTFENQRQHLNNSMISKISRISENQTNRQRYVGASQNFQSVRSSLDSAKLKPSTIDPKNATFVKQYSKNTFSFEKSQRKSQEQFDNTRARPSSSISEVMEPEKSLHDKIDQSQIQIYSDIKPIIGQNSVRDSLRESQKKLMLKKYEEQIINQQKKQSIELEVNPPKMVNRQTSPNFQTEESVLHREPQTPNSQVSLKEPPILNLVPKNLQFSAAMKSLKPKENLLLTQQILKNSQVREFGTITSPVFMRKISKEEKTNDEQYEFGEVQKRQILADILSKDSGEENYKPLININKNTTGSAGFSGFQNSISYQTVYSPKNQKVKNDYSPSVTTRFKFADHMNTTHTNSNIQRFRTDQYNENNNDILRLYQKNFAMGQVQINKQSPPPQVGKKMPTLQYQGQNQRSSKALLRINNIDLSPINKKQVKNYLRFNRNSQFIFLEKRESVNNSKLTNNGSKTTFRKSPNLKRTSRNGSQASLPADINEKLRKNNISLDVGAPIQSNFTNIGNFGATLAQVQDYFKTEDSNRFYTFSKQESNFPLPTLQQIQQKQKHQKRYIQNQIRAMEQSQNSKMLPPVIFTNQMIQYGVNSDQQSKIDEQMAKTSYRTPPPIKKKKNRGGFSDFGGEKNVKFNVTSKLPQVTERRDSNVKQYKPIDLRNRRNTMDTFNGRNFGNVTIS